jgi:CubicO group peptidase (beta-lactamase class C family)
MLGHTASRASLVALSAVVIGAAPAAAQSADPTRTAAAIDSIFSFATSETPGCAAGVSQGGRVIADRAWGLADVERGIPLSPRTKFDIGSTHKQMVAAAVLLLAEEGRLALSDDIRKFLPELPDYGHGITVDHLLTHTSGIRDWTALLPLADEGAEVLPLILRQRELNFAPGEEWAYSNSGYVLLKEIVGRVSGSPFADFARTRLFEPLGMTSTAYVPDILQGTGERAIGYEKEGDGWKQYMRLGNERGGGGVISTAGDLLRWNDALANGRLGGFVTDRLQEPATLNNGRRITYARGLIVTRVAGSRMVSHSGGAAGYSTWLGRFPDEDLSVVVMCNFEPVSATELAGGIADLFLPAVDPDAPPEGPVAVPGVEIAGRAGLFFGPRGEPLRLVANGDRLTIPGAPPLVPVSADRFRPRRPSLFFRSEDDYELTFLSNDEVELKSMEGETTRYRRAKPWVPAATDLKAVDGRYRNEAIGTVFEVVAAEDGLTLRFEGAPEKAMMLEPVERDTYGRNRAVVRFHRDAAGTITGFDYSNPLLRSVRFDRIGDRAESSPPPVAADAPASTTPNLENLVGEYEMGPGRTVAITLENGQLYGEPAGNPKRPLIHVSGSTFAVGETDQPMRVTFTLDPAGRASAMVMNRSGRERTLRRVQ